jgi:hypothetical protein
MLQAGRNHHRGRAERPHLYLHRPLTLVDDEKGATKNPPETKCCTAAPPVLEFDAEGNLLRSWGGPGRGYEGSRTSTASTSTATAMSGSAATTTEARS